MHADEKIFDFFLIFLFSFPFKRPALLKAVDADVDVLVNSSIAARVDEDLMMMDLERCDMSNELKACVKRLCLAVSPVAKYEQGMCFVAAVMLQNVESSLAVGCICSFLTSSKFLPMRADEWHQRMNQLVRTKAPLLAPLLARCGVDAIILCHAWLKTAFACFVPFDFCSRIWDCFFLFGFDYLLRVALAILVLSTPFLEGLSPNELRQKSFVVRNLTFFSILGCLSLSVQANYLDLFAQKLLLTS